MANKFNRKIICENGMEFLGRGFGDLEASVVCELVFNTSVVGYQEIVSDPSYADQAVVMTYPLIGNYGIADEDFETKIPTIGGLIVREYNDHPSNFRYTKTLSELLEENHIPGIEGVDTRMITRMIRDNGTCRVLICSADTTKEEGLAIIAATPVVNDTVSRVSCKKRWFSRTSNHRYNVVAIDCGIKNKVIRLLNARGCNVIVVPFDTCVEEIRKMKPDGILVSDGPGNPNDVPVTVDTVRQLCGSYPIFGIGLGHQIIAFAYGATIEKHKFGHRGGYPVREISTGKIRMTSQNHSYTVVPESLESTKLTQTHENILDKSVEGTECYEDKVFSVQWYPESAPGPQDTEELFDKFISMMKENHNA